MKTNIDLTENRMFSRNTSNIPFFKTKLYKIKPWDLHFLNSIYDLDYSGIENRYKVIATGGRFERLDFRLLKEEESRVHCDRCGVYLYKKPYERLTHNGLCEKCNLELDKQYSKKYRKPWM